MTGVGVAKEGSRRVVARAVLNKRNLGRFGVVVQCIIHPFSSTKFFGDILNFVAGSLVSLARWSRACSSGPRPRGGAPTDQDIGRACPAILEGVASRGEIPVPGTARDKSTIAVAVPSPLQ